MSNALRLIIRDRQKVVLDQSARSVSSFNHKGPFDILPEHSNFISIIDRFLKIIDERGRAKEIKISPSVMYVEDDVVRVYVETQITT